MSLGLVLALVLGQCAFTVRPSPLPYNAPEHKHNLVAGLAINPSWQHVRYSYNSCLTGSWRVETGNAFAHGAETTFKSMFAHVVWLESETNTVGKCIDLLVCLELTG